MKRTNGLSPLLVLLTAFVALAAPRAAAQCTSGPHSGTITSDQTWCAADSPHVLAGDVTVASGVTLTLQPGVIVQAPANVELKVLGHLHAPGTALQPIELKADAGGQWTGLIFDGDSGGGTGVLSHCTFRQGGNATSVEPYRAGVVVKDVGGVGVSFTSCSFSEASRPAWVVRSRVSFVSCSFTNAGDWPLTVEGASSVLEMTGCSFTGNTRDRVLVVNGALTGQSFTLRKQTALDAYHLQGRFVVPDGVTMTLEPGVKVVGSTNEELKVLGHLEAAGTVADPITFTAAGDDWTGLIVAGTGSANLDHCVVEKGGNSSSVDPYRASLAIVGVQTGSVSVRNSTLRGPVRCAWVADGRVSFADTVFTGAGDWPLTVEGASSVLEMTGCSFTGNTRDRVLLRPGAMTGGDATLSAHAGLEAYQIDSDFEVPAGRTFTFGPGTTLTASPNLELRVRGRLEAQGTAARPVRFTSLDSGQQWTGLVFDGGSGLLRHAVVERAGNASSIDPYRGGVAARDLASGSLRLENSRVTGSSWGIRGADAAIELVNTVINDNSQWGILLDGGSVTGSHLTLARNGGTVRLEQAATAVLTNALVATSTTGVSADASSSALLRATLWDHVTTKTAGNVTQSGFLEGDASFAADGWHVTDASAGAGQGHAAGAFDVDGETRPRPVGTLPDIGADEIDAGGLVPGRTATPITVGETKDGTAAAGAFADFVVTLSSGQVSNLVVRVEAAAGTGSFRLLVRNRQFPLTTFFDVEGVVADGTVREALVPAPLPGDWYLGVLSTAGEVPFTITLGGADRGVSAISPTTGGNTGRVTVQVAGVGFEDGVRVELRAAGVSLRSFTPISIAPTRQTVRLDLRNLPALACDVAVVWPDGEEHVLPGAFTILEGGQGTLETDLVLPGAVRAGRPTTLVLVYRNAGTVDMPAPLLEIRSVQNIPMRLGATSAFQRRPFRILGIGGAAGTAGTLSAGEQRVVTFHVVPEGPAHSALDFRVHVLGERSTEPIRWDSLEAELRSPEIDGDAWTRLWASFRADVGTTWADWASSLRKSADALSANYRFVHDPALLVTSHFIHIAGYGIPTNLSISLDADAPAPGPPLAFLRSYPNTILSRIRLGPFGRGWRNALWDTTLSVSSSGDVLLRGGSNELRRFVPLPNGGFLGSPDDPGRLSLAGGLFTLTESDLRVLAFRPDGHLASVADRFGNRVDLTYEGNGHLTRIQHTSGDQLTLQWNANGRIVRLTDHAGRVTTYDYDATGTLLTTVTAAGGRAWHYGYRTPTGDPADLALATVTLPDGTHRIFEYDAVGRLARRSVDGDVEPVSFGYDVPARMSTTDGAGNTFRVAFDEAGRVTGTSDPSGAWGWLEHDVAGNVARAVGPDGAEASIFHGAFGELKQLTDTLGGEASLRRSYTTEGGVFLRGLVDPNGNVSAFEIGPRLQLTALAFPDGSRWEATSDSTGEVTSFRNRRGQQVLYTRNARGQVVRKDLPGGASVSYEYDTAGRPFRVTGADGTFILEHDARGFLTRLSNPDGTWIAWELDDAGKRTRRRTSDGASLEYGWDAAGRLASIRDGSGTLLGSYSYDAAGRLQREERGNGTSTTYSYDPSGRPLTILHRGPGGAVLESLGYEWDVNGNPVRMTSLSGDTYWTWDALGRLTRSVEPTGRTTAFSYDSAGNRTEVTLNGVSSAYASNSLNQVTAAGSDSFAYDADGNLLTRNDASGTTRYEWDAEGRLTRVTHPAGGVFEYSYDSLGRLAAETRGTSTTRFSWDGGLIESERDGTGALVARYAAGYGLLARMPSTGAPSYFSYDLAGSTLLLTDGSGAVTNRYEYGPFGEPRTVVEGAANPYRFSGAWGVRTEAHGLLRMGSRPFDPVVGRFVAADPIAYASGYNLYAYCGNAPVHRVDPSGLEDIGGDKRNLLNSLIGLLETKAIGTISYLVNAPEGMTNSLKEMIAGYRAGDMKAVSHGAGSFAWTLGSSVGGAAIASIESGTALLWGAEGAAVTVGGVALAPVLAVAGVVIVASDIATDLYLEDIKQKRTFLERGPVPRNAYATWPDQIRPDGTLPSDLMELWRQHHGMDVVQPGDPNEKLATPGAGPRHRVRSGDRLCYVVRFENVPTASAPAQEVVVDDVLDPSLDLSTLDVVSIGWGDRVVDVASVELPVSFRETVPDYRPADFRRWFVDVSAERSGNRLRLALRTIDPTTNDLPEDALAGFLPPNDATGRGQGFLELSVRTKTGLPPGTRIVNSATIVFDTEPPITTNEVFHTIGLPGDVNDDGVVDPADVFYLVNHFYSAGPEPLGIADVNADERVDALDLFYLINFLYAGGPEPL